MRKNHKLFFFCHAELASASLPADATHQALQAGRFITEEKRSRNGFDKLTILSLSKDKFGMTKKKFGMTREKGITLVELLIDIGFVIVLLVGAFMLFNPLDLLKMANDNRRKEDLAAIQNALEQYHKDLGSYPSSTPDYQIKTIDANDPVKEWGS
ncbi:MAG: type II secretion system protein, partial [bacterium]|nr:type II secretion system protein [bacterium]